MKTQKHLLLLPFLLLLLTSIPGSAQAVIGKEHSKQTMTGNTKYGYDLYDRRTSKWVTHDRLYQFIAHIGRYKDVDYYRVEEYDRWGIIDERGTVIWKCQFKEVENLTRNGCVRVKKDSGYGLVDVYGYLIFDCNKEHLYTYDTYIYYQNYDKKEYKIELDTITEQREQWIKEDKEKRQREAEEEARKHANERKAKELESYLTYSKNKTEEFINRWQKRREFEKLTEFQNRVFGPARAAIIDSIQTSMQSSYIKEYTDFYFSDKSLKLGAYDTEKEVFAISVEHFGDFELPVPIAQAPYFKTNFSDIKTRNASFAIENDKVALMSVDVYFPDTEKRYRYKRKEGAASLPGPKAIECDLINYKTGDLIDGNTHYKRPQIKILSFSHSGNQVVIQYEIRSQNQAKSYLHMWVNGEERTIAPKLVNKKRGKLELTIYTNPTEIVLEVLESIGVFSEPILYRIN